MIFKGLSECIRNKVPSRHETSLTKLRIGPKVPVYPNKMKRCRSDGWIMGTEAVMQIMSSWIHCRRGRRLVRVLHPHDHLLLQCWQVTNTFNILNSRGTCQDHFRPRLWGLLSMAYTIAAFAYLSASLPLNSLLSPPHIWAKLTTMRNFNLPSIEKRPWWPKWNIYRNLSLPKAPDIRWIRSARSAPWTNQYYHNHAVCHWTHLSHNADVTHLSTKTKSEAYLEGNFRTFWPSTRWCRFGGDAERLIFQAPHAEG